MATEFGSIEPQSCLGLYILTQVHNQGLGELGAETRLEYFLKIAIEAVAINMFDGSSAEG
jgi:hypothetical protein